MISRYKNFLLEDEDYWSQKYSYLGVMPNKEIERRISRFKDFIKKINPEDKELGGSEEEEEEERTDSGSKNSLQNYQGEQGVSFSDMDKMIDLVISYLNKHGITNPLVQRAILATVGKESGFTATKEISYRNTDPGRIRKFFGSRVSDLTDSQINDLKKDDKAFWDKVYGGEWGKKYLGNTQPGDGSKYIGRGFNGITGRAVYQTYTNDLKKAGINADLVSNPEILERDPNLSAEVNALYFVRGLSDPIIQRKYGNKNPNDFKDFNTALKAVVNATAGSGTDITQGIGKDSYDLAVKSNQILGSKFEKALKKREEKKS